MKDVRYPNIGYSYTIDVENWLEDEYTLSVDFSLNKVWDDPIDINFNSEGAAITLSKRNFCLEDAEYLNDQIEITVSQLVGDSNTKVVVSIIDDDGRTRDIHIKLPNPAQLYTAKRIIQAENIEGELERIANHYNINNSPGLFNFVSDVNGILEFEEYIDLLNELSNYDKRFSHFLRGNQTAFFRKRLLNPRKSHRVKDISELSENLNYNNRYNQLPSVDLNYVLLSSFRSLDSKPPSYIESKLDRFDILSDLSLLKSDSLVLILSLYIRVEDWEGAKEVASEIQDRYGKSIDDPETVYDYRERAQGYASQLLEAKSIDKFGDNVSRYLLYFRKSKKDWHPIHHLMVNKAVSNCAEDGELQQEAEFELEFSKGFSNLQEDSQKAKHHFSKAIEISEGEQNEKYDYRPDDKIRALGQKAMAIANHSRSSLEFQKGLENINEVVKEIRECEGVSNNIRSRQLERIQGSEYDLRANINLQRGQIEVAITNFRNSIEHFEESGNEDQKISAIIKALRLEAFLSELNADFEKAESKYENIAKLCESNSYTNRAKAFNIRSKVCSAKTSVINNDYIEAKKKVTDTKSKYGAGPKENEKIGLVAELAKDYEDDKETELSGYLEDLDDIVVQKFDSVKLRTDYTSAVSTLKGVQRLSKFGLDEQVIDEIVTISLEDALIPDTYRSKEQTETTFSGISSLKVQKSNDMWQHQLPQHILKELEDARMNEIIYVNDYSDAALKLLRLIELYLEPICEYYGRAKEGDSWKNALCEKDSKLTLGDLHTVISNLPNNTISSQDELEELLLSSIGEYENITHLRNELAHRNTPEIDKTTYDQTKKKCLAIIQSSSPDCPIIVNIEGERLDKYSSSLKWSDIRKRIWIGTDFDIAVDNYYYISPTAVSDEYIWSVDENSIEPCTEERTVRNLDSV